MGILNKNLFFSFVKSNTTRLYRSYITVNTIHIISFFQISLELSKIGMQKIFVMWSQTKMSANSSEEQNSKLIKNMTEQLMYYKKLSRVLLQYQPHSNNFNYYYMVDILIHLSFLLIDSKMVYIFEAADQFF